MVLLPYFILFRNAMRILVRDANLLRYAMRIRVRNANLLRRLE